MKIGMKLTHRMTGETFEYRKHESTGWYTVWNEERGVFRLHRDFIMHPRGHHRPRSLGSLVRIHVKIDGKCEPYSLIAERITGGRFKIVDRETCYEGRPVWKNWTSDKHPVVLSSGNVKIAKEKVVAQGGDCS